jgi:hypothetical protein
MQGQEQEQELFVVFAVRVGRRKRDDDVDDSSYVLVHVHGCSRCSSSCLEHDLTITYHDDTVRQKRDS